MAVGAISITPGASQYGGKITTFVVLSCITAGMGGVIFGYDIGVSGGVTSMDSFLKELFPTVYRRMIEDKDISNYCKFNSQLLTFFTSSMYVSGLITTFFASGFTEKFGRRVSMLFGGTMFVIGAAVGGAAVNLYMILLARVLLGVGLGFSTQAVPLYLSEMAPSKYRGAFSNGFQFLLSVGGLIATFINYGSEKIRGGGGWRVSFGLAVIPSSMLALGAVFLPETPNSLIQQGKDPKTVIKLLQKIRGIDDVAEEFEDITRASDASKSVKHPFKTILERRYRPQLSMAILLPFFQQVTGINVIGFYAPVLFRTVGTAESGSLMSTVIVAVIGAVCTFASMVLVDRLGRRVLFMSGGITMLVSQVIIGAIMATQLGDQGSLSKGYGYFLVILVCIYVAGFGLSWGPLGWMVPSEIFPLEIRSAGQSITVAVNFLLTGAVAQTFLAMLCHMKSGLFFFFACWLVIMTVFIYMFLPETKNLPIEKIDQVWREHWFWKRIVDHGAKV
ncbi:hexose carrier protein HEX6-like protein [Carex littledalei]|uniref:Hexose carrier protein HEX6-like protein n=1 Tax=Carex littledalei TaxID=544730 RepID=A0A833QLY1_9POAL|nr:hexose carrier protein HEX6-like protein [Carex littledalei]